VLGCFVLIGAGIKNGSSLSAAIIASVLVDLTNGDRSDSNLADLKVNPLLVRAAQAKADDMAANGYFAHTSPDGKDPWYWFKQANYNFSYAGENLAIDFSDSSDVETAWMNSPKHRANILNGHFTEIGIATAVGYYQGHKTTFVVQEFGAPAAVAQVTPVTAVTEPTQPTDIAIATTQKQPVQTTAQPKQQVLAVAPAAQDSLVLGAAAAPAPTQQEGLLRTFWNTILATPKVAMRYAYYAFAALILLALLVETGLEIRRHHVKHLMITLGLLLFLSGLFIAAQTYFFSPPVIVDSGAAAAG
jgi:hypothetical protein